MTIKHIMYWTFVVAVALFFLRVPILAMVEYGFFEPFYVIWGKLLGFHVSFYPPFDALNPNDGWPFFCRIFGSIACAFLTGWFGVYVIVQLSNLYDYINKKEPPSLTPKQQLSEAVYDMYCDFDSTMDNWSFDNNEMNEITKWVDDLTSNWKTFKDKVVIDS